jgi:adenosylcobinamide-GDP ribazoletransferase
MLRPLALALSFLTRVPVRVGEVGPLDPARSLAFFPVVGALIGALLLGLANVLAPLLPPSLVAFVLVACSALITGALHLDGVADLADALGGGRGDRARMLEIMRDPRIGAHGAVALIMVLAGKLVASAELLTRGHSALVLWPIALAPLWARFACVLAIKAFPYARPSGLGLSFHQHVRASHVAIAALPCLAAIIWLAYSGASLAQIALASVTSAALCLALALRVSRRLGGITGDVHGACIELCELLVLLAACCKV